MSEIDPYVLVRSVIVVGAVLMFAGFIRATTPMEGESDAGSPQ